METTPHPPTDGRVRTRRPRAAGASAAAEPHLLLAAWGLVLAARTGDDDVLFGVLGAAAGDSTLPLHLRTDPDTTVAEHLRAAREGARGAAGPDDADAAAVLQTAVDCRPSDGPPAAYPPCEVVAGAEAGADGALYVDHVPETLTPQDARRLLGLLDRALTALAAAPPRTRLGALELLPPQEFTRVVHEWNDTAADTGHAACLHELFTEQAARTPHAVAVLQGADRLDYAALDALSDRVARRLAACGIGSGDVVAVSLRRTVHAVVALLGVLKSGAAYAPVDPALPPDRARGLIEALRAPAVLTDPDAVPEVLDRCASLPALRAVLWVGPEGDGPDSPASGGRPAVGPATAAPPSGARTPDRAHPEDPAYVIFTSGSTGVPKGVLMTHAPAVNLIRWVNSTYDVGPGDRILCVASLSFDLSVYDLFGLLACGGSIRLAAEDEVRDPKRLLEILDGEPVTFWDSAPAALQQLQPFLALRTPPEHHTLRLVFLSGDWVPLSLPAAVRSAFAAPRFVALGGATEAAIWSNFFPVEKVDPEWSSIPYGRPVTNARYHVLDSAMRPAPVGAPGDLYIGGDCLATAYHGAPRLTAGKFVPDPFGGRAGARLYRTGDRARYRPDGVLEFLGRRDHQVKIRGFRVELGEVEACLAEQPEVASAAAVVHGAAADARLVAYAVPRPGARPDPETLRRALAGRLPLYMVPADVVVLDALPVTANGKLDRAALPVPGAGTGARPAHVAPRTPVEKLLAEVWADLLGVPDPGVDDNFFDLGGHSLLLTRLVARLETDLQVEVDLLDLLDNQTLGEAAAVVERLLLGEDGTQDEDGRRHE